MVGYKKNGDSLLRQFLEPEIHDDSSDMKLRRNEMLHNLPLDMIKLCNKIVPCHIGVCPWAVV